jgi:hypothetical protein
VADYRLVAIKNGQPLGELAALSPRFEFRLDRPSMFSFRINALHPTAAFVSELDTDILVYRENVKTLRGVITSTRHIVDESSHYIEVSGMDYRGRLAFRLVLNDQVFVSEDDVDIAWQAIDDAQNETGGNLGITRGIIPAAEVLTGAFPAGISVSEAIDLVANTDDGFDWDISPDLQFDIFRPRGTNRDRILDYGGLVSEVTREFSATDFGNVVRGSGDDSIASVIAESSDLSLGRWERQVGFPQIDNFSLLTGLTLDELNRAENQAITYRVRLRSSEGIQRWGGVSDIWLGDTVRFVVRSGNLDINELQRVLEIDVNVGDDGREDVFFVLDGPRRTFQERINDVLQRLTELERQ